MVGVEGVGAVAPTTGGTSATRRNPWNVALLVLTVALLIAAGAFLLHARSTASSTSALEARTAALDHQRATLAAQQAAADARRRALSAEDQALTTDAEALPAELAGTSAAHGSAVHIENQGADLSQAGNDAGAAQLDRTKGAAALHGFQVKIAAMRAVLLKMQASLQQLDRSMRG
jgi:hypothetical protein